MMISRNFFQLLGFCDFVKVIRKFVSKKVNREKEKGLKLQSLGIALSLFADVERTKVQTFKEFC